MRRLLVCAGMTAWMLAGCGGGGDGKTPVAPPPPPPSPPTATSLVVAAGNDQQATAGMPLPAAPTVRALSVASQGVAGVVVTFSIESGGGSVQDTQVTTGADGTASPGQWTLGATAGPNSLRAAAPGLSPVSIRATGTAPPLLGADTTIGAGGGSVTVSHPGQPGNGFRLTIPSGALPSAVHVTVDVDTGRTISLPSGVTIAGPIYRVSGFPASAATGFLSVRLPMARGADTVVAAFLRDPGTGRLELLAATERTATTYSAVTRHLSSDLMLRPPAAAKSGVMAAALVGGGIEIVTLQAAEALIANGAESGFRPSTDDWEFVNQGSYLAPGGHCAGQSLTAIWYYLRRKPLDGPLFDRFSVVAGLDADNRDGYRFASVVQDALDWNQMERVFAVATGTSSATTIPLDKLHFTASVLSMLTTGEPQLITLQNKTGGHAVIAFRADRNHLYIADPNFPGQTRVIDFNGTTYTPFPAQPKATAPEELYDQIRGVGITELVSTASVDALWPQVLNSTIGTGLFPALTYQYYDLLEDKWMDLPDPLTTRQDRLRVRSICASCTQGLPAAPGTTPPNYVQWLIAFDQAGSAIGDAFTPAGQTAEGSDFPVRFGNQRIGLFTQADTPDDVWSYVDWRWLNVTAAPFSVEPGNAKVGVGVTQNFVARPFSVRPTTPRYVWNFDDGSQPVTQLNDSSVQHTFTTQGLRAVSVEMWDQATSRRVARAVATIDVSDSVTTWIFDELKGTIPAWFPVDVSTSNDYVKQGVFFTAIKDAPATGRLEYVEPPTHPENARIRLFVNPNPTTIGSLLLGARNTFCAHVGVLTLSGTTSNGTLTGKGRINSCLLGPTAGSQVLASKFEISGTAVGRNLTGTITAIYQDFTKSGNNHIPSTSQTVTFTFKAHRP